MLSLGGWIIAVLTVSQQQSHTPNLRIGRRQRYFHARASPITLMRPRARHASSYCIQRALSEGSMDDDIMRSNFILRRKR